ncbi:UNVERIFIED_CONTAM: hypothetical protein K2H54_050794 [Gekko kuhli]
MMGGVYVYNIYTYPHKHIHTHTYIQKSQSSKQSSGYPSGSDPVCVKVVGQTASNHQGYAILAHVKLKSWLVPSGMITCCGTTSMRSFLILLQQVISHARADNAKHLFDGDKGES